MCVRRGNCEECVCVISEDFELVPEDMVEGSIELALNVNSLSFIGGKKRGEE